MIARWLPVLGALLAAGPASAGKPVVYVQGGVTLQDAPASFDDAWKNGVGFVGGVGYRTGPWLEIAAAVSIDRFGTEGRKTGETLLPARDLTDAVVTGGGTSVLILSGEARIYLPLSLTRMSLWATGAGGFYRRTFEDVSVETEGDQGTVRQQIPIGTENTMAVAGGAGVGFRVSRDVWFTIEARYLVTVTADEQTRMLPARIGFAYR